MCAGAHFWSGGRIEKSQASRSLTRRSCSPRSARSRGNPTCKQWEAYGKPVGRLVKWSMFLLGDWINYGEQPYGEKYTQALSVTGLSYNTLQGADHRLVLCHVTARFVDVEQDWNVSPATHSGVVAPL